MTRSEIRSSPRPSPRCRFQTLANLDPEVTGNELQSEAKPWTTFGKAIRDVAAVSYDEPKVRKRDEMLPSHAFNREVLTQLIQQPEFGAARVYTSGNAAEALFAAIEYGDEFQSRVRELAEQESPLADVRCLTRASRAGDTRRARLADRTQV